MGVLVKSRGMCGFLEPVQSERLLSAALIPRGGGSRGGLGRAVHVRAHVRASGSRVGLLALFVRETVSFIILQRIKDASGVFFIFVVVVNSIGWGQRTGES